jgi:hypothetical protein
MGLLHPARPLRSHIVAVAVVLQVLALIGLPLNAAGADAASGGPAREYEIKAAFLYNFTKFIEWPAHSFADAGAPIVIGVLGDSPCTEALQRLVKDRKVNGRAIVVRRIASGQEAQATHLLFVGSEQEAQFAGLQPAIELLPILTVGETPGFPILGGAIEFVPQGDKLRFEINIGVAERAGLKISAQLQKLATVIRRGPT